MAHNTNLARETLEVIRLKARDHEVIDKVRNLERQVCDTQNTRITELEMETGMKEPRAIISWHEFDKRMLAIVMSLFGSIKRELIRRGFDILDNDGNLKPLVQREWDRYVSTLSQIWKRAQCPTPLVGQSHHATFKHGGRIKQNHFF